MTSARWRTPLLVAATVALVGAPWLLKPYGIYLLTMWAIMTIAAIGLNLTLGYAGQISLAQGAFVGVGAYTAAILTTHGSSYPVAFLLGPLLCLVIGWLLGYPALRVQHHYLAFVTLAFSTLVFLVFRNEEWLTKGIYGISGIPRPNVLGWSTLPPRDFYYFSLAVLALVSLATWWLVRSPWGRAFMALRENPVRASSLGVDTRRYTLLAFAIGSALGGIAGVLYAPLVQFIDPSPFTLGLSLNLLLMVIAGGSGYFLGPVRRRLRLGAAARVAALHRRAVPDAVLGVRDGADRVLPLGPARPGRAPCATAQGRSRGRARCDDSRPRRRACRMSDVSRAASDPRSSASPAANGASPASAAAVLDVRDLTKRFGGITAVDDVSFDVKQGEILGIIGPNGSGKSTLFNCILGQLQPTSGEVRVAGRTITGMRPSELNRLGIGRTFQLLQVFPQLTVRENLILAGQEHRGSMWSRLFGPRDAGLTADADRMIGFFRLSHLADEKAGALSYGQQKLLDAAMAFMAGPRLVLLDEPAGGVNPTMLAGLRERLRAINAAEKATFVVIEHNMEFVMALCTRILVLAEGRIIAAGPPESVRNNPAVIEAYLGR